MTTQQMPVLKSRGKTLNTCPDAFGLLTPSTDIAHDGDALRARMERDGYLFLPGALDRDGVLVARRVCLERLAESGWIDTSRPLDEAVVAPGRTSYFMPNLAEDNAPLMQTLYDGPMIDVSARLLGGPVRHFDFTWMRAVTPGNGTAPHCDWVYMGRGTPDLYTAWTPLGDIPLSMGGLIVLEGSNRKAERIADYLRRDVDSYCANGPSADKVLSGEMHWESWDDPTKAWDGAISHDPVALREQMGGGRWLSADYRAGDILIFSMRTLHASLDNGSDRMRLSSDTRYQRADEPVDERWIGESPIAHGVAAKRGRIC